jgi:hypothetical protein
MSWAAQEMAGARLGDQRLNQRAASLLQTLGAKPTLSIPAAARGWAETQAAYRFFDHAKVNAETVLEPHVAATVERARAHPVVLAIQDTTELDFTGKDDIEGLGPLTYEAQRGLHLHPTFLVTPERVPLGVFDAWIWARDPQTFGQSSQGLPIEDKESVRWLEGYQRLVEVAPQLPQSQLVYLADREADIYELFVEAAGAPVELLVRASHDRALEGGGKLRETLHEAPELGTVTFELPRTAKRRARAVTQSLHARRVSIRAPNGKATLAPSVELTAVLAHELDPPEGETAVQWLLLTTMPVESFEQAVEKMQWYLCRWEIELLFKTLKSGCEVEELQLQHIDRLEPAIAMYLIIAWRVLLLTMTGRRCPDMPCDVILETDEWRAIYIVSERAKPPKEPPPLDTIVRMLAGFGGFLNRKHDGHPGNKSVWIGLQRTRDFVLALAAQREADL